MFKNPLINFVNGSLNKFSLFFYENEVGCFRNLTISNKF